MKNYSQRSDRMEKEAAPESLRQSRNFDQVGMMGACAVNEPIEREREIPERLALLGHGIKYLSERVALLRDRTAVVSGPTPPMNKNEVIPSRTALGGELAEMASRVALIVQGVDDILNALEL